MKFYKHTTPTALPRSFRSPVRGVMFIETKNTENEKLQRSVMWTAPFATSLQPILCPYISFARREISFAPLRGRRPTGLWRFPFSAFPLLTQWAIVFRSFGAFLIQHNSHEVATDLCPRQSRG